MGKIFKALILLGSIFLVIVLLFMAITFQDMAYFKEKQLSDLYARKDDLVLQGQKIDTLIYELNTTIQNEAAVNKELTSKIQELAAKQNSTVKINTTPIVQTVVKPAPKPAPAPVVITRAS